MFLSRERNRIFQQVEREEEHNPQKKKLFLQLAFVLDGLASMGEIPYKAFDKEFFTRTKTRFEDAFSEFMEYEDEQWSMERIIWELSQNILKNPLTVDHDEQGDVVFVRVADEPDERHFVTPEVVEIRENRQETEIPNELIQQMAQMEVRADPIAQIPQEVQVIEELPRPIHWPDVHEMFSKPYWPWLPEEMRQERYGKYLDFLHFSAQRPINDNAVRKEAKRLAMEFWKPALRYFPHVLYLLKKLSIQYPDGFKKRDTEQLIEKTIPRSWGRFYPHHRFRLGTFYMTESDLIMMNLIMRSDEEDPQMLKVNKIIGALGFHEIHDPELSMIYQYTASSRDHPRTTQSIHTFMCDDYPEWQRMYDQKSGTDRIWEICSGEYRMFSLEYDCITAKEHAYKIPLPMCISFFVV